MGYIRIWADERGETHFEDIEYPSAPRGQAGSVDAVSAGFRVFSVGEVVDWHTVSRRMYYVTLSGEAEISVSDGETRRIGPGNVTLVEDLTGKGHRTRMVGPLPRVCLAVTLR